MPLFPLPAAFLSFVFTSFFSLFVGQWYTYMYINVCMCIATLQCAWAPRLTCGTLLNCFFTLFLEAGFLSQTQSLLIWLVWLASLLWGPRLWLQGLELQVSCHVHTVFTWVLGIY